MKRVFCLTLVFFAAPLRAVYAEDAPKVSCDTIRNAYGTIDSALGDKKRGVGKRQQPAGIPGGIPGMPGGIPGMGAIPGMDGTPGAAPKAQTNKPLKDGWIGGSSQDGSAGKQSAKKKKKKAEPASEYKFKQDEIAPAYKFDKRANPITKDPKPKKARKKVIKLEPPPEEPAPVDGPPIPQKKLPTQPVQDEFID